MTKKEAKIKMEDKMKKEEARDREMQCECTHEHPETVREVLAEMPDENVAADLSDFFKVFGDSSRMRILFALDRRELCVCDLSAALGTTISAISHQLRLLRANHLITSRREGKNVFYRLADDHVRDIIEIAVEHLAEED